MSPFIIWLKFVLCKAPLQWLIFVHRATLAHWLKFVLCKAPLQWLIFVLCKAPLQWLIFVLCRILLYYSLFIQLIQLQIEALNCRMRSALAFRSSSDCTRIGFIALSAFTLLTKLVSSCCDNRFFVDYYCACVAKNCSYRYGLNAPRCARWINVTT